jgi:hypothetical protein
VWGLVVESCMLLIITGMLQGTWKLGHIQTTTWFKYWVELQSSEVLSTLQTMRCKRERVRWNIKRWTEFENSGIPNMQFI